MLGIQLIDTTIVRERHRPQPDYLDPGHFRAFSVTAVGDHDVTFKPVDKKESWSLSRDSLLPCLPFAAPDQAPARRSDRTQVARQLIFEESNQSEQQVALSRRLVQRAVADYFSSMPWRKTPLPDQHDRSTLLLTLLAQSDHGARLHRKAAANNLKELEAALRHAGTDINCPSAKSGITPLLWAAINRHWSVALTLLESGACVNAKGRHGDHFLSQVFTARLAQDIPEAQYRLLIYTVLLKQSELELVSQQGVETVFAFVWKNIIAQVDIALFEYLVDSIPGIKDQLKGHQVVERMMAVVISGHSDQPDVVAYLMGLRDSAGNQVLDMNHTLANGDTFLMLAVKCYQRQTVKLLLEDPVVVENINRVNDRRVFHYSAYTYACRDFSLTLMRMLEAKGATRIESALDSLGENKKAKVCDVCDSRTTKRSTGHVTFYRGAAK